MSMRGFNVGVNPIGNFAYFFQPKVLMSTFQINITRLNFDDVILVLKFEIKYFI